MNRFAAIFIFIFCIDCNADDLSGHWVSSTNTNEFTFSIKLVKGSKGYAGSYCAVSMAGNRIDCPYQGASNFHFEETGREFQFTANYSSKVGSAKITNSGDHIIWTITKQPDGEHYAPNEAILVKK